MKLDDGSVWCLPDGYKIDDRSLDDIRAYLNPSFSKQDIESLDKSVFWARALDGTEYMPGLVGLNNIKANDYINVILQILARVRPVRNFFLDTSNYAETESPLLHRIGELMRKVWHPKQFKGQVSPHEFLQSVMKESHKRFSIEHQTNPLWFFVWIINTLHRILMKTNDTGESIISQTFFGELEVWTKKTKPKHGKYSNIYWGVVKRYPCLYLDLDLPPVPLFKDAFDNMQIPQVPLFHLLEKFNGIRLNHVTKADDFGRRCYRLSSLPKFLILSIHRFHRNAFFSQKNHSVVNFSEKPFPLIDAIPIPDHITDSMFSLIASVSHEGALNEGVYKVYINRLIENRWYEVQDLVVREVIPQIITLSEAYLQVYEKSHSTGTNHISSTNNTPCRVIKLR
jgi:U4/U6.U5 tri-snRNP-associated protein 2